MSKRVITSDIQHGSTQSLLACKSCRRKKLKCDRNIPQCRNCLKVSRACEYPSTAQKPGPRPGTTHRRAGTINHSTKDPPRRPLGDASSDNVLGVFERGDASYRPSKGQEGHRQIHVSSPPSSVFSAACEAMKITETACWDMIDVYLRNMTSFSLFHQPTLPEKLNSIGSEKQLQALLTSMLAFSVRFKHDGVLYPGLTDAASEILEQAHILNEECLRECGDERPPLHLLQSYVIATWMLTSVGVRGRAWRMVGQCIRMAYEMKLHILDPEDDRISTTSVDDVPVDARNWIAIEEKRRTWWAVWLADVFCSTIYQSSTAIDWTRNRTNIESSDDAWFRGTPTKSCWLHTDPSQRWKDMRDCGNQSPHGWFIIINSYKWDSLSISLRRSAPTTYSSRETDLKELSSTTGEDYKPLLVRRREVIENCLRCALDAMPDNLQFHDGYLPFEPSPPSKNPYPSMALIHDEATYVINIVSQVNQMLLCRRDVRGGNYINYLGGLARERLPNYDHNDTDSPPHPTKSATEGRHRWRMCLAAADRVASIVRHSAPHHHRLVSPNVAMALWMAAATQIAALVLYRTETDVDLAQSNLDLLTTTLEKLVRFWHVPRALIQALPSLKRQLSAMNARTDPTPSSSLSSTHRNPTSTHTTHLHSNSMITSPSSDHDSVPTPTSSSRYPSHYPIHQSQVVDPLLCTTNPNPNPILNLNTDTNIETIYTEDTAATNFNDLIMNNGLEGWEGLFADVGFGFWTSHYQV